MIWTRIRLWTAAVALGLILSWAPDAHGAGPVLGSQDGPGTPAAQLTESASFSRVARVLVDPAHPEKADQTVAEREAAGMEVQIVIGGLTQDRAPEPEEAAAIVRRWPDTFAFSIVNEPQNARSPYGRVADGNRAWGDHPCAYRKMFTAAYRAMKRAGAKRVWLGEYAPAYITGSLLDLAKCGPLVADGLAYHAYPGSEGSPTRTWLVKRTVNRLRKMIHTPRGYALPLAWTEYGMFGPATGKQVKDPAATIRRDLAIAKRYGVVEVVFYGAHGPSRTWDTALWNADGSPRSALDALTTAR